MSGSIHDEVEEVNVFPLEAIPFKYMGDIDFYSARKVLARTYLNRYTDPTETLYLSTKFKSRNHHIRILIGNKFCNKLNIVLQPEKIHSEICNDINNISLYVTKLWNQFIGGIITNEGMWVNVYFESGKEVTCDSIPGCENVGSLFEKVVEYNSFHLKLVPYPKLEGYVPMVNISNDFFE